MFKIFIEFFMSFSKDVHPARMLINSIVFLVMITWLGTVLLITLNFDTVMYLYNQYTNDKGVKMDQALVISNQLHNVISEQRLAMGVDRLYISKFHNGKVDLDGTHFIFFSRVSESVGPGVSSEIHNTQNLPLSIFPGMVDSLLNHKCYYANLTNSTVENAHFFEVQGVKSTIICPIYDTNDRLIGVIGSESVSGIIGDKDAKNLSASLAILGRVVGDIMSGN